MTWWSMLPISPMIGAWRLSAVEFYGGVDILVNNAGILRPTAVAGISAEEWDLVLNVNLEGNLSLCAGGP